MPKTYTPIPSEDTSKANINNDAFYRVVLNGTFAGQANVMTLYYRIGFDLLPGSWNFGGAEELANAFMSNVWGTLKGGYPTAYTLNTLVVYPYNGDFDPAVSLPYTLTVEEQGAGSGETVGSAASLTCSFNLEGMIVGLNGWFPPKRGYVAFGPYRETDTDGNGRLTALGKAFYEEKLTPLGQDLFAITDLVAFWPIRISTTKIAGVLTLRGFTDISGINIRNVASFRTSRKLEA